MGNKEIRFIEILYAYLSHRGSICVGLNFVVCENRSNGIGVRFVCLVHLVVKGRNAYRNGDELNITAFDIKAFIMQSYFH